jgi:hypothetical protein
MLSFICGAGRGSFDSSKAYLELPISDHLPKSASSEQVLANVTNGNVHIKHDDLKLAGRGLSAGAATNAGL